MNLWFTRADAPLDQRWIKRFLPDHWTVDFPRGSLASMIADDAGGTVVVAVSLLRRGDLAGLIWDSVDRYSHPGHARETSRDYRGCKLGFRWQSTGIAALDVINGPTLTIEGRDGAGAARIWLVRLWNYAVGSPTDARIILDFDALDGGFTLPANADRVFPRDIDRMFISLVAPDYLALSTTIYAASVEGRVTLSEIACDGSGSVLACNDAVAPETSFGLATAYDDMYPQSPSRIIRSVERLGYRGTIVHYVGMSHYMALGGDGLVDASRTLRTPALDWHRELARLAKLRGYDLIWSLSYEIFDAFCPTAWKQRAYDGSAALTFYVPPSTLVSPAHAGAIGWLGQVAATLVGLSVGQGLVPRFQVGEPWWWINPGGQICLYDTAARAALLNPPAIPSLAGSLDAATRDLLDRAGILLAASTASVVAAAKAGAAATVSHVLAYLPTILDPARPELKRANLPVGWASPAFDRLQLEDYEWVTGGRDGQRAAAYALVAARLNYAPAVQHYLSGFVATAGERDQWRAIIAAASDALARGIGAVVLWAFPQVVRDGLTLFGKEQDMAPFDEVDFPIAIGVQASVAPGYSTTIVTSASGREYRNANWQQARLRFDAGPGIRGEAELGVLLDFFRARRGPAVGFRFRDPFDHGSAALGATVAAGDQSLGSGDGARTRFLLVKAYGTGERRRITRPVAGSVRVAVAGGELITGWTLGPLGAIDFAVAPATGAVVTAGYLFDVPVRFADDRIDINRATFAAGDAPSVPLVEVREDL